MALSIFEAGYVVEINYLQIERKDPNPTYNWLWYWDKSVINRDK